MSYLTRACGAVKLVLQANAPSIMVGTGIVAMGTGAVLACKKTLGVEEVLAEHIPFLEQIKTTEESPQYAEYTKDRARNDRIKIYTRVTLDMIKLYGVPAGFFIGGAGLVISGHRILLQRNATLALAFTGMKQAFDAYRARVIEEQGHEADQRFKNGFIRKEFVDSDTGERIPVTVQDGENPVTDPYNRIFEQGASSQWQDDLGINKMFIHNQQRFAQQLLSRRGYLWLSEVYTSLGFEENDVSRVVGWKVRKLPDGTKDIPMVDFGLDTPHPDDQMLAREQAIYLDFNCQGLIVGGKVQRILEKS